MSNISERNNIDNYKVTNSFLNEFKSNGTKTVYKTILKSFFDFINKTPDEYINDDFEFLEDIEQRKLLKKYKQDVKNYWNHLIDTGRAPKSVITYFTYFGYKVMNTLCYFLPIIITKKMMATIIQLVFCMVFTS